MALLSPKLDWSLANTKWASTLNPIISLPILNGQQLSNIALVIGANVIPHSLGQPPRGWIITDQNGIATIYRSQPFNSANITLTSSAKVTVSIWIY